MGNTLNFNEEIKKCKTQDDLFGENGLMKKFVKEALESMLQAEMEEHLGRKKHERIDDNEPNYRNGIRQKTIISSVGEMEIEVPRDRKGQFKPIVVENYQSTCGEFDKKIISMYAKGMTVGIFKLRLKIFMELIFLLPLSHLLQIKLWVQLLTGRIECWIIFIQ